MRSYDARDYREEGSEIGFPSHTAMSRSAPTEVLLAVLGAHQTATLWCFNMCHPWRPTSMRATSENLAGKRQRTCF